MHTARDYGDVSDLTPVETQDLHSFKDKDFCVGQSVKRKCNSAASCPPSYTEEPRRLAAAHSFMKCFELLSCLNGFLAEIFDGLMNGVLILLLKLIASETFISALKGSSRDVELFNSTIRKCIITQRIAIIIAQRDFLWSGYTQ